MFIKKWIKDQFVGTFESYHESIQTYTYKNKVISMYEKMIFQ